jgi:glycosyltransferase involved in cell wall biosynthesis
VTQIAYLANWFLLKQRPHHCCEYMAGLGHPVTVYVLRSRGATAPPHSRNIFLREIWHLPTRVRGVPLPLAWYNQLQTNRILRIFAEDAASVHIYATSPLGVLPRKPEHLVYDCMDDWGEFSDCDRPRMARLEQALCEMADRIWVTSRFLQEKLQRYSAKIEYVPNGVDYEHFSQSAHYRSRQRPPRPVLGYVGYVGPWFDVRLIADTARILSDWDIVVVGPVAIRAEAAVLASLPNVTLSGHASYDELPRIMATFDVAMIPFVINDLIRGTNPVKLYEYLAAGLPVIATPMPEVAALTEPGVVLCAETAMEFAHGARTLLASDRVKRRQEIARSASWHARFAGPLLRAGLS